MGTSLSPLLLLFLFLSVSPLQFALSEPTQDRAALLSFITQTPHENRVQWNTSASACDWVGVTCDPNRTAVIELHLPGVGLLGPIPPNTLGSLSSLRVLSLRSNRLTGTIPDDLAGLSVLRGLYLQDNLLSGPIPTSFGRLGRLSRLDLSGNNLTGEIPFAINNITRLTTLFLQRNKLSGSLPSISIDSLAGFNVSYNSLNGSIPKSLSRFPDSSFVGNLALCGDPLPPCNPFFPSPAPSPGSDQNPAGEAEKKKKKKLSTGAIVGIAIGSAALLLFLILALFLCLAWRRRGRQRKENEPKGESTAAIGTRSGETGMTSSSKEEMSGAGGATAAEKNKLVFVGRGGGYSFDLEDLLRASAEVLGKGIVGTSYKAVLEEGTTVVVKRLKDVVASKREFETHMELLGQVEHQNLLPVRAYYYSKDEKLLVFDYLPAGSLSSLLHGSRGSGRSPLDWDSRIRIALAAGRGLAHLHSSEPRLAHGDIKASNVLLRSDLDASALSDFSLSPLFGSSAPPSRVAGYRAPEVLETRRPTPKSDVYSFGVLLLELLTGKAPNQASLGEEGIDLPRWVQSVVREEWTAEVFDVELMRYQNIEEEMVQLLQIAMACVALVPDARPDIADVVRMMEEIVNRTAEGDDTSKAGGSGGPTPPSAPTP